MYPGRVVDDKLGNTTTLNRAAAWVQACEQHRDCNTPSSLLPTRVVDVGEDQMNPVVRLVEPSTGTSERYIALSHCWGRSGLPTTTKENKGQRLDSISLEEMSKSFKDAIVVTRF